MVKVAATDLSCGIACSVWKPIRGCPLTHVGNIAGFAILRWVSQQAIAYQLGAGLPERNSPLDADAALARQAGLDMSRPARLAFGPSAHTSSAVHSALGNPVRSYMNRNGPMRLLR